MRSIIAGLAAVLLSGAALAAEQKPYDAASFKAAQAAGKSVVVHVTAPWCPTCRAQHQVINEISTKPQYADVTVYQVDFDSQKDALKAFGARSQSTLIGYKGTGETSRIVGDTSAAGIEGVFASVTSKE